jgi:hypothetical protein
MTFVLAILLQESALEKLHSDRIDLREEGVRELALLGDAGARALEPLLSDPDPELAGRARRAYDMNRRARALPATLARRMPSLLERDVPLRELLALALTRDEERFFADLAARSGDLPPSTWYRLVRGRASADDLARTLRARPSAYALAALQEADPRAAVRAALDLLRSPSVEMRVQAAFTLGEAGPASVAAELKRLLRDPAPAAREAAAIAIARLVPRADVPRPAVAPLPLRRADQLAIFAAAVDGRSIDDPVLFSPTPRDKDAPASCDWCDVRDALATRDATLTLRRRWFGFELVTVRRER